MVVQEQLYTAADLCGLPHSLACGDLNDSR